MDTINAYLMNKTPSINDYEIIYPLTELLEDDEIYEIYDDDEYDKFFEEREERRKEPIVFKIYNDNRNDNRLYFDKNIIVGCSYKKPNELLNELLVKYKNFYETYKGDETNITPTFKREKDFLDSCSDLDNVKIKVLKNNIYPSMEPKDLLELTKNYIKKTIKTTDYNIVNLSNHKQLRKYFLRKKNENNNSLE